MDGSELLRRFAELERAVASRDALEHRLAENPSSELIRERSLAACELVLRRRTALYRALIRGGWVPPPRLVSELLEDELLVDEPLGGAGG